MNEMSISYDLDFFFFFLTNYSQLLGRFCIQVHWTN